MAGDAVRQIKERLTIIDVVSPYVELHKAGKNYKGKSPFTNEKTPSFYVSPDRGMYYCFSTSQGGDIFTFVEIMEGVDFKGALKILADKAGVELIPEDPKKKSERDRQFDVLNEATIFYERSLKDKKTALTYLQDRGVKMETIAKWRIGYAPGPPDHGWRELKNYLEHKKYNKSELLKAGLIKGADSGKEPYDVFRDRVMFPIFDSAGKVVAFSGRILTKDSEAPKYVNSPETELFNKSEILYGYDKAKQGIRNMDFSLIVEGQFDVVMSHQAGYQNTVAVSGTALTPHHVMLLQRLSNRVVLALDADRAGIAAVKRAADLMLGRGMDVKVAQMPDGQDPADIIKEDKDSFKKIIGHSVPVVEYLLNILEKDSKEERAFKLNAREEVLPYVAKIPNRIDQEHFESLIADRLKTTKEAIHVEVQRIIDRKTNEVEPKPEIKVQKVESTDLLERKDDLLKYLVSISDSYDNLIKDKLVSELEFITGVSYKNLKQKATADYASKLLFTEESRLAEVPLEHQKAELVDRLNDLNNLYIKDRLRERKEALVAAENDQNEADINTILVEISELQKSINKSKYTLDLFTQ